MLVFVILLFFGSAHGARIETDDVGTINLSEILKRIVDLEEKLEEQERINEEQNNMIRRLQFGNSNGNDFAEDERKTSVDNEMKNRNQWMKVDFENTTRFIDDMRDPKRGFHNSNNVSRSIKLSYEKSSKFQKSSKFVVNGIQRRALEGGVAFYSYMSRPEPNPGQHQTIIFDSEVTNVGGNYNHHAGIFIAPTDGVYTFIWTILCYYGSSSDSGIVTELVINSNPAGGAFCTAVGDHYGHTTGNGVVEISQGDVVYIRTHPSLGTFGQIMSNSALRSTFSGWKLF